MRDQGNQQNVIHSSEGNLEKIPSFSANYDGLVLVSLVFFRLATLTK